jgi:hypothetical protein
MIVFLLCRLFLGKKEGHGPLLLNPLKGREPQALLHKNTDITQHNASPESRFKPARGDVLALAQATRFLHIRNQIPPDI